MAWIISVPIGDYKTPFKFILLVLFVPELLLFRTVSGLKCGHPGSPAYGRPSAVREDYEPGQAVGFTCALGYTLRGNLQRTCLPNGTWTGHVPICDRSLSTMEQHASSRATLALYAADKAIDGNKDTCTYTDKRKPRWIRVDLQKDHTVQAVALTVPRNMYRTDDAHFTIYVISVKDATTASYHKCADFNGKFSASTVKLSCPGRGIHGSYVHIEDNRSTIDYFSACEIEIFVRKATYECGEVERPANSYTMSPDVGVVEYRCMFGYRLVGEPRRHCLPSGEWSGSQPLCKEIVCPVLDNIEHGTVQYLGPSRDRPVQGTTANITCNDGYRSDGKVLQCSEEGEWSGGELTCHPVDCGAPKVQHHLEKYRLLNGTTTYGSLAAFYCGDQDQDEVESPSDIITCREDGTWSGLESSCSTKNMISTLGLVEENDNAVPNGIIIGMAVVVFLLFIILILILLFKRKQLLRRPSTDSLPSKETSSSLGHNSPSPLTLGGDSSKQCGGSSGGGTPYENDVFYASIAMEDDKAPPRTENNPETDNNNKQQQQHNVERGILSSILFAKRRHGAEQRNSNRKIPESTNNENPQDDIAEESETTNCSTQPVYAQIDYQEKRRSRLAKSLTEQLDCSTSEITDKCVVIEDSVPTSSSTYDAELDSEPIKLRELPPIPASDDDHSSGTYASLSQPPEPPSPITMPYAVMRDNNIYVTGQDEQSTIHCNVMKDNDLYSTE